MEICTTRKLALFIIFLGLFYQKMTVAQKTAKCFSEPWQDSKVDPRQFIQFNENDGPNCTIHFGPSPAVPNGNLGDDPNCVMVGHNSWRIFGADYHGLTLNCTAPYLIDFAYDGFRPTEAIHIFYWRDAEMMPTENSSQTPSLEKSSGHGIKTIAYGMNVTITSISDLYATYRKKMEEPGDDEKFGFLNQNLSQPIVYPRTGRFVIGGMHEPNKEKLTQFYFFFEEPLLANKISFMKNEHTAHATFLEGANNNETAIIKVPCRPSHYTHNVTLTMTQVKINNETSFSHLDITRATKFDPRIGFQVPANVVGVTVENLASIRFQCSIKIDQNLWSNELAKNVLWETDLKTTMEDRDERAKSVFGIERHNISKGSGTFDVAFQIFYVKNFFVSITCAFDSHPGSSATLLQIGYGMHAYAEYSFSREFALPLYKNLSYFVREARLDPSSLVFEMDRASSSGAVFCSNDKSYVFYEYVCSGFTNSKYPFPAGTYWPLIPFQGPEADVFINMKQLSPPPPLSAGSGKFYSYQNFTFVCRLGTAFSGLNRLPLFWHTTNLIGQRRMIFKDVHVHGDSTLETKLTADTRRITCTGALWQNDDWRSAFLDVDISSGMPPKINSTRGFSYQFPIDSKNKSIICQVTSDPLSRVWWEDKHGQILPGQETNRETANGQAIHSFEIVSEDVLGDYFCQATNPYGTTSAKFKVEELDTTFVTYMVVGGLALFGVLFAIALGVYFYYRSQLKKQILTVEELKEFKEGIDKGKLDENSVPQSQPYRDEFEVPPNKYTISTKTVLGSGAFGLVMKGTVRGDVVAVKTVKPGADKNFLKSLLSELKILMYLGDDSPYLVHLIGASTTNLRRGIVYVFVEFCEGGSLLSYLQNHRNKFLGTTDTYENSAIQRCGGTDLAFDLTVLHRWAHQIAQGMAFLSSKKVIHGDLAARNILLTSDRTTKITDFGLSRQLYSYAMYMKQSQEPLPWRWMALESLCDLRFSCESDVWSYGVTLWELYSLGQVPFPSLNWDTEFVESLKNGMRAGCPKLLSNELYTQLLLPCWENGSKNRPTFSAICSMLEPIMK